MKKHVRLIEVQGDQEDFADLIGNNGVLSLSDKTTNEDRNTFFPDNKGDFLSLLTKNIVEKDGKIIISTRSGNIFTFKIIGENK
jgi:hypothetical protein